MMSNQRHGASAYTYNANPYNPEDYLVGGDENMELLMAMEASMAESKNTVAGCIRYVGNLYESKHDYNERSDIYESKHNANERAGMEFESPLVKVKKVQQEPIPKINLEREPEVQLKQIRYKSRNIVVPVQQPAKPTRDFKIDIWTNLDFHITLGQFHQVTEKEIAVIKAVHNKLFFSNGESAVFREGSGYSVGKPLEQSGLGKLIGINGALAEFVTIFRTTIEEHFDIYQKMSKDARIYYNVGGRYEMKNIGTFTAKWEH